MIISSDAKEKIYSKNGIRFNVKFATHLIFLNSKKERHLLSVVHCKKTRGKYFDPR